MKKLFAAVVFLFGAFGARAQQYHPLVDSGAVWNQEEGYCIDYTSVQVCYRYGYKLLLDGDTIIQNNSYALIKYRPTYYYHFEDFPYINQQGYEIDSPARVVAAIREDSSKKVWVRAFSTFPFFPIAPANHDTLLYDFNLQVGDTFRINSWAYGVVTIIDSIQLLNGEWRKKFQFDSPYAILELPIIEGIGSESGLFNPYQILFDQLRILRCYRNDSALLYEFSPSDCAQLINCDSADLSLGIENTILPSASLQISPNPARDFIDVTFSSPGFANAKLEVTDVLGRSVFSSSVKSNVPLHLSVSEFDGARFLFFRLERNGELISVKKVVLQ